MLILSLIVANVLSVMLETVPAIDHSVGNQAGNFFDTFEAISVWIFTAEYLMRLFSVVKDKEHLYSPWFYATTFFGIVDLIAILPWYIEQIVEPRDTTVAAVFRVFRVFRLLQLEHFVTAFTILDDVWRASKDALKATGLMAAIIWILSAAIYYIAEKDNPNWRKCAEDVPSDVCYSWTASECSERGPEVYTDMLYKCSRQHVLRCRVSWRSGARPISR